MEPSRHPTPGFESSCDRIRRFVQDTLGCACPDAAFEGAGIEIAPADVAEALFQIVVAERLLLRGYRVTAGEGLPALLTEWLEAGKGERDARGLNRFRLVLASESPEMIEGSVAPAFERWRGADDRVHLHVLGLGQLDGLFAHPC